MIVIRRRMQGLSCQTTGVVMKVRRKTLGVYARIPNSTNVFWMGNYSVKQLPDITSWMRENRNRDARLFVLGRKVLSRTFP